MASYRAYGARRERAGMEFQQQELPMPLTSKELIVLSKCLMAALKSEQFDETDKEVIRKMTIRIDRYAERQGAYWEK
jgi:ABC-type arginine transport system ATPase subunit